MSGQHQSVSTLSLISILAIFRAILIKLILSSFLRPYLILPQNCCFNNQLQCKKKVKLKIYPETYYRITKKYKRKSTSLWISSAELSKYFTNTNYFVYKYNLVQCRYHEGWIKKNIFSLLDIKFFPIFPTERPVPWQNKVAFRPLQK